MIYFHYNQDKKQARALLGGGVEVRTMGGAHASQRQPVGARELQFAQTAGEIMVDVNVINSILWAAQIYTSSVCCSFPTLCCPGALFILPKKQLRVYKKCTFCI
jgi:hypothetical protein